MILQTDMYIYSFCSILLHYLSFFPVDMQTFVLAQSGLVPHLHVKYQRQPSFSPHFARSCKKNAKEKGWDFPVFYRKSHPFFYSQLFAVHPYSSGIYSLLSSPRTSATGVPSLRHRLPSSWKAISSISERVYFLISRIRKRSSGVINVNAAPFRLALPVRPILWR